METASPGRKIDEHNQNAKHPAIYEVEEVVSDAIKEELREAKKKEREESEKLEADIMSFKRDFDPAEINLRENSNFFSPTSRENYDTIRDQLYNLKQSIQEKKRIKRELREMGRCEYGYEWTRVLGGYRCQGGLHFVSDGELQSRLL